MEEEVFENLSEDEVRCPECSGMLVRLKKGEAEVRCKRCKKTCRAKAVLVRKIIVEIVQPECNTAPASV